MNNYFYILCFVLMSAGVLWQFISIKKMAGRKFISDYRLEKSAPLTGWNRFVMPTGFLIIGFINPVNPFLVAMALFLFPTIIADQWWFSKYKYQSLVLQGSHLISNQFKVKTFNLEELISIGFLPWSDSFRLNFEHGQSLSIQRSEFEKESLIGFLKTLIRLSKFTVVIHEDAKSKIYTDLEEAY